MINLGRFYSTPEEQNSSGSNSLKCRGGFWIGEVEEKQADPTVQKVGVLVLGSIIEFSVQIADIE